MCGKWNRARIGSVGFSSYWEIVFKDELSIQLAYVGSIQLNFKVNYIVFHYYSIVRFFIVIDSVHITISGFSTSIKFCSNVFYFIQSIISRIILTREHQLFGCIHLCIVECSIGSNSWKASKWNAVMIELYGKDEASYCFGKQNSLTLMRLRRLTLDCVRVPHMVVEFVFLFCFWCGKSSNVTALVQILVDGWWRLHLYVSSSLRTEWLKTEQLEQNNSFVNI